MTRNTSSSAESIALAIELDWHPGIALAYGTMADWFIPSIHNTLRAQKIVVPFDLLVKGDTRKWDRTQWYSTQQSPAEFLAILMTGYEQAYSKDGP
jgi:hypothetical protein